MNENSPARPSQRGQVLAGVVIFMLVLLIIIPALVQWLQQQSRMSVKDRKATAAFNLAEAAVERGMWMLKSSTFTWATAQNGTAISGYNFDVTYTDVPGGRYRIQFTSGVFQGASVVTVWGEGQDSLKKETRSIQAIYQNLAIAGPVISNQMLTISSQAAVEWGPVLAMNDITVTGKNYNTWHYPRKLSAQVVHPFDTNGLTTPNTDLKEWWSGYNVPEMPQIDFDTLRSSGQATGTYNCNGAYNNTTHQVPCGAAAGGTYSVSFSKSNDNTTQDNRYNKNYVWFWDGNLTIYDPGINGTVVVMGNMTTLNADWYGPDGSLNANLNLHVPPKAWMEYQQIDTTATNQYPADNGLNKVKNTYVLGSCSGCEAVATGSDVGFYGFVYVGGNGNFEGDSDIYGAIWVKGNWLAGSSGTSNNMILYNDLLALPTLNVTLVRQSWKEVSPNGAAWQ